MRDITKAIIHCSATKEGVDLDVEDIRKMHKKRGWSDIGYHFLIKLDGTIEKGRPISIMGAHVRGHNKDSVGIVYIGGLDEKGKAKDTRTTAQQSSLLSLLNSIAMIFPIKEIKGHRDYSKDLDGDGVVESHEWMKQCPCFDAQDEYKFLLNNK